MRIIVLDPRSGDHHSDVFVLNEDGRIAKKLRLGYVPELRYDPACGELAVVETQLRKGLFRRRTSDWLKRYDIRNFKLIGKVETPERPMYAGYPNRSSRVAQSSSGRYLYFLSQQVVRREQIGGDLFRLRAHRFDRGNGSVDQASFVIDSCMVDFGQLGSDDDDLYFHLSCDFPSTVAFGSFRSSEVKMVQLVDLPSRRHCPQETNGSWLDSAAGAVYCVSGEGSIYELMHASGACRVVVQPELEAGQSVGLQMLYGAGDRLFLGVSANLEERSFSLASEVRVFTKAGRHQKTVELPFPAINFVATADGERLVAVSPYDRAVAIVDVGSSRVVRTIGNLGFSPAEVMLIP